MAVRPHWRSTVTFSEDGPGVTLMHESPELKVVLVGLGVGQSLPVHPGPSASFHFLDGGGVMVVGTEEVDVAAGATVVVPTGVSRGSGRRPGWCSWEALASRVHPRRTDRTDARCVRRLVSAPPWVDARLWAEEAVTRSGSACTPRRPRLESLCHSQRPLHRVLGQERSVTPIAFFTILTVNISMYRTRLHFSARTGRTTGSISLAAAAATRLLLQEVARGGPEASVMDWSDRAACLAEEPELFFPIGNTGPALMQTEEAKAACNRCRVIDACLQFALASGQSAGIWGGLTEAERRVLKRRSVRAHHDG